MKLHGLPNYFFKKTKTKLFAFISSALMVCFSVDKYQWFVQGKRNQFISKSSLLKDIKLLLPEHP